MRPRTTRPTDAACTPSRFACASTPPSDRTTPIQLASLTASLLARNAADSFGTVELPYARIAAWRVDAAAAVAYARDDQMRSETCLVLISADEQTVLWTSHEFEVPIPFVLDVECVITRTLGLAWGPPARDCPPPATCFYVDHQWRLTPEARDAASALAHEFRAAEIDAEDVFEVMVRLENAALGAADMDAGLDVPVGNLAAGALDAIDDETMRAAVGGQLQQHVRTQRDLWGFHTFLRALAEEAYVA